MNVNRALVLVPSALVTGAAAAYGGYQLTKTMELHDLTASKYQRVDHTTDGDVEKQRSHAANITTGLQVGIGVIAAGLGWAVMHLGAPNLAVAGLRDAGAGVLTGGGCAFGVGALFANSLYAGSQLHA